MIFYSLFAIFLMFPTVAGDYVQQLNRLHINVTSTLTTMNKLVLFVSASIDDPEVLSKILLIDGAGTSKTALELKNGFVFQNSDLKNGWMTKGPINVLVTASRDDVDKLQGIIYFNDLSILDGRKLFVYDVTQTNHISLPSSNSASQLLIVLNTLQNSSTLISNWKQRAPQNASLYLDYYLDLRDGSLDQVFSNPINGINNQSYRFEHVEPFSLRMSYFHGIIDGGARFTLSPGSIDEHNVTTTKVTTTGVITKSYDGTNYDKTVTFLKNSQGKQKPGFSGYQALVTDFFDMVTVKMVAGSIEHASNMSSLSSDQKVYGFQGDRIQVSSQRAQNYYVQYFNVEY